MPGYATHNELGDLARRLDDSLNGWRSNPAAGEAVMLEVLDDISARFKIVGGAFAVANIETNSFDVKESFRDNEPMGRASPGAGTGARAFFPYKNIDGTPHLKRLAKDTDYSSWIHGLFGVQRARQRLEFARDELETPEYLRRVVSDTSVFFVPHEHILGTLRDWLSIWDAASRVEDGLGGTLEQARRLRPQPGRVSIFSTILKAWRSSPNWVEQMRPPPEWDFFVRDEESELDESASPEAQSWDATWWATNSKAIKAAHLFSNITVAEAAEQLGQTLPMPPPSGDRADKTLHARLAELHSAALFPVIPYLFLKLADRAPMHHAILPLAKTTEFQFRTSMGRSRNQHLSQCGVVMLCSVRADLSTEEQYPNALLNDLYSLTSLMRIAAEPITDQTFYGSIFRRRAREEGTTQARRSLAHQIKGLSYGVGDSWLVSFDRWSAIKTQYPDRAELALAKVAPLPNLYEAVGSTLSLWSLSHRPEDLFPRDAEFPRDLAQLAEQAWNHARNTKLLAACRKFDFENEDIKRVWQCDPVERRTIDVEDLRKWTVDAEPFGIGEKREKFTGIDEINQGAWKKFGGILRVLVIACENFLDHSNKHAQLKITVRQDTEANLEIVCINATEEPDFKKSSVALHDGYRGLEVLKFLCKRCFDTEFDPEFDPGSLRSPAGRRLYQLKLPIGRPEWLHD